MSVIVDELGLVVPGNIVKKYEADSNETTLRVNREQLDQIVEVAQAAKLLFAGTSPSPLPSAKTGGVPEVKASAGP
jgi:hypothetical protein